MSFAAYCNPHSGAASTGLLKPSLDGSVLRLFGSDLSATGPSILADELFAVTVIWNAQPPGTWRIWLSTVDHRRVCCSEQDVDDPALAAWLADLPGWESHRLRVALECAGLHLVWRRTDR